MKTFKEQLKINKGIKFYINDIIIIKNTPNMISNYIDFDYYSLYWDRLEHLSLLNDIQNWKFLKGISDGGYATVLYQHWKEVGDEYVEVLVTYEDSMPYKYRFNRKEVA